MASSQKSSPYGPVSLEDPGQTQMFKMTTFSPSSLSGEDTGSVSNRSASILSGDRILLRPDSNTSSSNSSPRSIFWKPLTFRAVFLIPLCIFTIGLIIFLELLNQKGIRDGGIFFVPTNQNFAPWQIFCYRYLPTIVAVIYGMVWAVLDLDVKRLEPYFQLSKLEGASSKDSLMLKYPFEFLVYVPVASFHRRHWSVFISGFALIVIFWVVTPLHSAILATKPVIKQFPTEFHSSKEFIPFDQQRGNLTTQFEYTAYGVAWLGEEVAPFVTKEYMAVPFKPLDWNSDHVDNGGNESWSATTRVYSTKVDCKPADKSFESFDGREMWYLTDDMKTCTLGVNPISSGTRNMMYFGTWWGSGLDSRTVHSGCNYTDFYIGVWAQAADETTPEEDYDISAIFCRTSFYYVDTVIFVDGATLRISNPQTVEPSVNSTFFGPKDRILDTITIQSDMLNIAQMDADGSQNTYRIGPSSTTRFDDWGLSEPSRMMGYIIASGDGKVFEDFQNPDIFGKAVERAHKLLFSNALNNLLQPIHPAKASGLRSVTGVRLVATTAVVVVSQLVHALEGCLVFVALCLIGLLLMYKYRRNNLFSDPDSLSAKMALVADSKPLLEDFEDLDECPDLQECIPTRTYQLEVWADGTERYRLDRVHNDPQVLEMKSYNTEHVSQHTGTGMVPIELQLWVGVTFGVILLGLLVSLCVLYKSSLRYNGLPPLTNSQVGVQIIFSFIPTVIATLIEPFWVLVTRAICAYQPYHELRKGNASAASSLCVKYTNLPAALILPRAIRSRNFLVASLSAVTLLANFLAVALSGLFENIYLPFPNPSVFTLALEPVIHTQVIYGEEQWLLANTNISAGTALPPFVSPEFYFLPFTWNTTTEKNSSDLHTAVTRGFGANLNCQPLESEDLHLVYYTPKRIEAGSERNAPDRFWANNFNVTVPKTSGNGTVNCTAYPASRPNQKIFWTKNLAIPPGPAAGEYLLDLEPTAQNANQSTWDECLGILIIGWARGTLSYSNHGNYNFSFVPDTYKSTTLLCQQKVLSAEFEVVVDGSQRVQSYNRVSPFETNNPDYFQGVSLTNFTAQMGRLFMAGSSVDGTNDDLGNDHSVHASMDEAKFHNDSAPVLFPHRLVAALLNNTKLTDPTTPVPEFDLLNEGFQDLYKRLFALSLSLNSNHIFNHSTTNASISGTTTTQYHRISMNRDMFLITTVLLGINIIICLTTSIFGPKRFLPRFPNSIAAEVGFFYASKVLRDVAGTASMSTGSRQKHLEGLRNRYGYGVYIGEDGKKHRGVELQSTLTRNMEYTLHENELYN